MSTPSEVAEQLGVPEKTLADWRYRGVGPAFAHVGRYVRYRPQDVEEWVRRRVSSTTPA